MMRKEIDKVVDYAKNHEMVINHEKTKVILFNNRRKYDFDPKIYLSPSKQIEVVEKVKLLGLIISSDLSWKTNTAKMC